jgi:hypothetical protein
VLIVLNTLEPKGVPRAIEKIAATVTSKSIYMSISATLHGPHRDVNNKLAGQRGVVTEWCFMRSKMVLGRASRRLRSNHGQEWLPTADCEAVVSRTCDFVEPMTGIEPAYSAWEVDSRRFLVSTFAIGCSRYFTRGG